MRFLFILFDTGPLRSEMFKVNREGRRVKGRGTQRNLTYQQ